MGERLLEKTRIMLIMLGCILLVLLSASCSNSNGKDGTTEPGDAGRKDAQSVFIKQLKFLAGAEDSKLCYVGEQDGNVFCHLPRI